MFLYEKKGKRIKGSFIPLISLMLLSTFCEAQNSFYPNKSAVPQNDVVWTTLGKDENDSMPIGNGSLAANVWTEQNGDLMLFFYQVQTLGMKISINLVYAQKGIEKLTADKIDSLQHIHVDTMLYYISYCGECDIIGKKHTCYLKSGYLIAVNSIIYKQQGKFYTLTFDCYNLGTKRQLNSCESLPYFISIIPTLKVRDKFSGNLQKKTFFPPPIISDGGFENAELIINKKKQYISMAESEKTDLRDKDKTHYWVNKEIKLLTLIADDITIKKAN